MFSADDNTPAQATVVSDNEITLTWEDGQTEELVYLNNKTLDEIAAEANQYFKPGTWRGADSYYFFDEDGIGGVTLSFDMGIGVPFNYEISSSSEGNVVFSIGDAETLTNAVISDVTEDSFTITWEDGSTEQLVYVSSLGSDEFLFYSNDQLQEIALRYYQAGNDGNAPQYSEAQSNNDGTATISLYDDPDDLSSAAAKYTVDRVTLKGTDDNTGAEVDMWEYVE